MAPDASAPSGETASHFHPDHLGSPRQVTDELGNQVSLHAYYPFGSEATDTTQDPFNLKFTGHERDENGGGNGVLDYMHARHCSPVLGRFVSIDPIASTRLSVPQSWNKYSYGANNPQKYIDPDGRAVFLVTAALGAVEGAAFQLAINALSGEPLSEGVLKEAGVGAALGVTGVGLANLGRKGFQALKAARVLRATRAGKLIAGTGGRTVARKPLEAAASSGGSVVKVLTRLDTAPQIGRALSTATGEGAGALASAARPGGKLFGAEIPQKLIKELEAVGLLDRKKVLMNGVTGEEFRFLSGASEFINRFFKLIE